MTQDGRPDPQRHLLATMSHELRTPLNVIIGFSESLARDAHPPAEVAEFATAIHDAGQQLLALVNTLLDVARIEQGPLELQPDIIDLAHMLTSSADQLAAHAQRSVVEITVMPPSQRLLLRGDEKRLRQVIGQLLANALAFTPAGGRIDVTSGLDAGVPSGADADLMIEVRDTGIGIASGQLDAAFEPFAQLDSGLARRTPGPGLGLYVSRALIAAHGGTLRLDHAEGGGTVATIVLPRSRLIGSSPLQHLQDLS